MPKTPSKRLYDLIHSLTGSEKRYFKLFIHRKDEQDNKYLRLFDAIGAQDTFDEEALKKAVYGNSHIESRKYSELKSYLYDLILKCLQSYDEKTSVDFRIKQMLMGIRVLYRRSHFEEALSLIAKTRKLSLKYEQFTDLLQLSRWEKQIAYARTDIAFLDDHLARISKEEKAWQQALQQVTSLRNLFLQLLVYLRKDATPRDTNRREGIQALMQDPMLKGPFLSHRAHILHLRIQALYFFAQKDYERFYSFSKDLLSLMESKTYFLNEDVSEYISALSNLTFSCGWLKKYDEVEVCLKKFKRIRPNNLDDELKIARQYYMNKLGLSIVRGEFEEGVKAIDRLQKDMQRFDSSLFKKNTFFFQYFYLYFGTGDYGKALEYLNEWLNLSGNIERRDLQSLARILNLIIHYEMGNTLLLESLVRSASRYLKKQPKVYDYERAVLNFIRESVKVLNKKQTKQAFQQLKAKLKSLFDEKEERPMLELFDILSWVESKIQEKPFAEVVQEKYLAASS